MRQIIMDTETTGLEPSKNHRIVEIGCVEMINRKLTGNTFHVYLNPERIMDEDVIRIHGITNEFVQDKPIFAEIAQDFIAFIKDSEMIAHNAQFDVNFLNYELKWMNTSRKIEDYCTIIDSLVLAKKKHPGQKNNLDALCKRYCIDNSARTFHGALLDSEILADVYLSMTGGQTSLLMDRVGEFDDDPAFIRRLSPDRSPMLVVKPTEKELKLHKEQLKKINQKYW